MSSSEPTRNLSFSFSHPFGQILLRNFLLLKDSVNFVCQRKRQVKFHSDIIWNLGQTFIKKNSRRFHNSKIGLNVAEEGPGDDDRADEEDEDGRVDPAVEVGMRLAAELQPAQEEEKRKRDHKQGVL